jgi:hypothetical protein
MNLNFHNFLTSIFRIDIVGMELKIENFEIFDIYRVRTGVES